MKLYNYITKLADNFDIELIKKNCSQYIGSIKGNNLKNPFVYRGVDKFLTADMTEMTPRQDRKPTDTSQYLHKLFDDIFKDKFGWKPRSGGVFTTPDIKIARKYGTPFIFMPLNGYKYIWSEKVADFYVYAQMDGFIIDDKEADAIDDDIIKEASIWLEELSHDYDKAGLHRALSTDSEVIFKCSKYYMINTEFKDELKELFQ